MPVCNSTLTFSRASALSRGDKKLLSLPGSAATGFLVNQASTTDGGLGGQSSGSWGLCGQHTAGASSLRARSVSPDPDFASRDHVALGLQHPGVTAPRVLHLTADMGSDGLPCPSAPCPTPGSCLLQGLGVVTPKPHIWLSCPRGPVTTGRLF